MKNLPKLGHYLPFEQKKSKLKFFQEKPKNLLFRGLGVEKPQNNEKFAKTRLLPTF